MGKPVMERLLEERPQLQLLVTFFSPSGYFYRRNYEKASVVTYLPVDNPRNAKRFLDKADPVMAVFVKYDLWHFYLRAMVKRDIPYFLMSATFRDNHQYFKNRFFRRMLEDATDIFVQDDRSIELLEKHGLEGQKTGDTRCDRVIDIASSPETYDDVATFCKDHFVVMGGSTWAKEEEILSIVHKQMPDLRMVIAPHNISEGHLKQIEGRFGDSIERLSNWSGEKPLMLVDQIGMLASMYQYATVAFVGGGFTGALHNILEPAAYGVPVCFGPKHERFHEADALIKRGGAIVVKKASEMVELIQHYQQDNDELQEAGQAAKDYIMSNQGATEKVTHALLSHL